MAGLRTIGILGGMGPEATILMQQKLVQAVQAHDDADHIPLIVDMNTQVPSRIAHLIEGTGENPGPVLAAMARRLQSAGAEALAMPCNTAHHYAAAITGATHVPFLNMVDLAADHAAGALPTGSTVGMLASPAVRRTGLFEAALARHGLATLWPDDDAAMLAAIRQIKRDGPCGAARQTLAAASAELLAGGAALQFVACSEFSLIADAAHTHVRAVDTLDCLVAAVVAFARAPAPALSSAETA